MASNSNEPLSEAGATRIAERFGANNTRRDPLEGEIGSALQESLRQIDRAAAAAIPEKSISQAMLEVAASRVKNQSNMAKFNSVYGDMLELMTKARSPRIQNDEFAALTNVAYYFSRILVMSQYDREESIAGAAAFTEAGQIATEGLQALPRVG